MNFTDLSAENFVPTEILGYTGRVSSVPIPDATIKGKPEFFKVQEVPLNGPMCTVAPSSDLTDEYLRSLIAESTADGTTLTAVTLVKVRMTTFAAQQRLAKLLGVRCDQITYAGLKDYKAETAQLMVVSGLSYEEVARHCKPVPLTGAPGFFIKDARPVNFTLDKGKLNGNHFTIRVDVPGMTKTEIEEFIKPVISHLAENGNLFPNGYGRQRLGRRQNLLEVGRLLIEEGPEAAIKCFLTQTSDNEQEEATRLRMSLLESWQKAEASAASRGETVAEQHFWFDGMRSDLKQKVAKASDSRPKHEALNMTIEYQIVLATLQYMDFDLVMAELKDAFSLWIGAYQGYWFNQVLAKLIRGEITLGYQGQNHRVQRSDGTSVPSIPLFMQETKALNFYRRHCPEAIPVKVHPVVERHFLSQAYTLIEVSAKYPDGALIIDDLSRKLTIKPSQIFYSRERTVEDTRFLLVKGLTVEQVKMRLAKIEAESDGKASRYAVKNLTAVRFDIGGSSPSSRQKGYRIAFSVDSDCVSHHVRRFLGTAINQRAGYFSGGPWRKAFVPIRDLAYEVEDGAVTMRFMLRSGAYATTILGIIFNLEGDERTTDEERSQLSFRPRTGSSRAGSSPSITSSR